MSLSKSDKRRLSDRFLSVPDEDDDLPDDPGDLELQFLAATRRKLEGDKAYVEFRNDFNSAVFREFWAISHVSASCIAAQNREINRLKARLRRLESGQSAGGA